MWKKLCALMLALGMGMSMLAPVYAQDDGTKQGQKAIVYIADYTADGMLMGVHQIDDYIYTTDSAVIDDVNLLEGQKAFVWDSDMKPLTGVIKYEATPTPSVKPIGIWDFAEFNGEAEVKDNTDSSYQKDYSGLELHIGTGDSITADGLYWSQPSGTKADATTVVTNNRYIKYTCDESGTLTVTYKGSANASNKHPRLYLSCGESLACTTKDANSNQLEANQSYDNQSTDFNTAEFDVSAGKTYYLWSYYYNTSANTFTISEIAFEKAAESVRTRNIYGSNMLLQRNEPIYIDGKSTAVDDITVSLINEKNNEIVQSKTAQIVGESKEQEWNVTLDAVSDYTGSYTLKIEAGSLEAIEYSNIIFGDLYLFSGQSNMWKQVSYYKNIDKAAYGTEAVEANATDKIRVMHTKGSSMYGQTNLCYDADGREEWRDFSTYSNVSGIAAPAYTAAVKMQKETGVPIGIITNAYPGSYISSWFPNTGIDNCNANKGGSANERNWYNGRIYPIRNLKLSGIFWYQGEADAATTYHDNPYEYYSEMMPKLIDEWRTLFGDSKLPFYYVQLSRIGSTIIDENNPDTGNAGKMPIKRAQSDVYLNMADKTNVGMISTLDLYGNYMAGETANCRTDIHLGQKNIIGERMAAYALKDIYGKTEYADHSKIYSHGPIYQSSEVKDNKVVITFDCTGKLAIMPSKQYTDSIGAEKVTAGEINPNVLNEFELAGEDNVWHSASAEITSDNQVTVSSSEVAKPVKVRYCGTDYPESPNLTDESGLPSYVFEKLTDNAEIIIPTPTPTPTIEKTFHFDFGTETAQKGYTAVTPDMIYNMSNSSTAEEGYCGFLGTSENSYANDVLPYAFDHRAIDGFSVVKGQYITLSSGGTASETDADADFIRVPEKSKYLPANASKYEGRYPIRFSMKADRKSYYTVTVTLKNASDIEDACISLFSEKRQIVAEDVNLEPSQTITFKFNVDIEDRVYKDYGSQLFEDDMLNISVSGENAAISSMTVEKHRKVDGTIKGAAAENGVNDGVTLWACTDSTGCDCPATVPFFALQNYAGVAQALVKYMPEDIAVSNQGERGIGTSDNGHFNGCQLKQGDYLYVEYGHNEEDADSYYANLEKYYKRAKESGAKLIVVSAVNRHNSWNGTEWTSNFTGYIEKAQQFVKEKIDAGADDIAFVDMNTLYVNWMNEETARIQKINPALTPEQTMEFYYRSVKGSSVDGTHMNDAGADQAAYYFFKGARDMLETAKTSDDQYILTQAEVLRPIVENMKTTIGDTQKENLPMSVSDEIINAGTAPNSYWDTVAADALNYNNAIAINGTDAVTNENGTITLSTIGIRLMNALTDNPYAKAVVTVKDAVGSETKYYTENNYDCMGDNPGAVKVNTGFITVDKNHNNITDDEKVSSIIIPADSTCTIQIVSCDDNWVVGENPTVYSAVYTVHKALGTIFNESGTSLDGWSYIGAVADHTEEIKTDDDGSEYLSIHSSNADSGGTKKNYGYYKALNENIADGKYRLSFKTRFGAGVARFALVNSVSNASNPFSSKVYPLIIDSGKIYLNNNTNPIYTAKDDEENLLGKITAEQWINIDMVLDLDMGTIFISVAGSEYQRFDIADWQSNTPATLPIKYFGIAGSSDGTATMVDIKDIELVSIPQSTLEKRTVTATADAQQGSVKINGDSVETKEVDLNSTVTLKAVANSGYAFVNWTDAEGAVVSESSEYIISRLHNSVTVTANFEKLESGTIVWDFAGYGGDKAVTAEGEMQSDYNGLEMHINANDTITDGGLYWNAPGGTKSDKTTSVTNNRYIKYIPEESGTLKITFTGSIYSSKNKARLYVSTGDDVTCTVKDSATNTAKDISKVNTDTTLEMEVNKGQTYYVWGYYYGNSACTFTIKNITFTPTPAE